MSVIAAHRRRKCDLLLPELYLYIAHSFGISQNKSWDRFIVNVLVVEVEAAFLSLFSSVLRRPLFTHFDGCYLKYT